MRNPANHINNSLDVLADIMGLKVDSPLSTPVVPIVEKKGDTQNNKE